MDNKKSPRTGQEEKCNCREHFGTSDFINEGFCINTGELEKSLNFAKVLFDQRFDFKRKFEFVMENDPQRPSTMFKLRYLD